MAAGRKAAPAGNGRRCPVNLGFIQFAYPWVLLLLLLIPGIIIFQWKRKRRKNAVLFSIDAPYKQFPRSFRQRTQVLPTVFFYISLASLIFCLARPQGGLLRDPREGEGIDIMISLDVSISMLAKDLDPDRLTAAKQILTDFVKGRPNDRMGLDIFSGESYTLCPLTLDHDMLLQQLKAAEPGFLLDGTAIGDGLGMAVARLESSKNPSKVIILLTDGVSTRNTISPEAAAGEAAKNNITVYTIGVGTMGKAMMPVRKYANGVYDYEQKDVEIDEAVLQMIASRTKGRYFRATDNSSLEEIFEDIDKMEKSKLEDVKIQNLPDQYTIFLLISLGTFLIYILLQNTVYRKLE